MTAARFLLLLLVSSCHAFTTQLTTQIAAQSPILQQQQQQQQQHAWTATAIDSSSTTHLAAATLDPTTLLGDLLGGLIGTPGLILAVPILAAIGVASLIAFAIVSYASPAELDDE